MNALSRLTALASLLSPARHDKFTFQGVGPLSAFARSVSSTTLPASESFLLIPLRPARAESMRPEWWTDDLVEEALGRLAEWPLEQGGAEAEVFAGLYDMLHPPPSDTRVATAVGLARHASLLQAAADPAASAAFLQAVRLLRVLTAELQQRFCDLKEGRVGRDLPPRWRGVELAGRARELRRLDLLLVRCEWRVRSLGGGSRPSPPGPILVAPAGNAAASVPPQPRPESRTPTGNIAVLGAHETMQSLPLPTPRPFVAAPTATRSLRPPPLARAARPPAFVGSSNFMELLY